MTDKSTVLDTNPWDTADESPAPKAKVVDFTTKIAKMQNAGDNFNGFYKIIIDSSYFQKKMFSLQKKELFDSIATQNAEIRTVAKSLLPFLK